MLKAVEHKLNRAPLFKHITLYKGIRYENVDLNC